MHGNGLLSGMLLARSNRSWSVANQSKRNMRSLRAMAEATISNSASSTVQDEHRRTREGDAMASEGWGRRDVIRGVAAATLAWALPLTASREGGATGVGQTAPRDREARRRWALARMDEMVSERLRCREKGRTPREVRDCQAEFERRYRAYNDIYIEATRE